MNKIEEVKEILLEFLGEGYEQPAYDLACQICQLFPQPLDEEGLREKIKDYASKWFCKGRTYGVVPISKNDLLKLEEEGDQILALLQPKIGEAKDTYPEVLEEDYGSGGNTEE